MAMVVGMNTLHPRFSGVLLYELTMTMRSRGISPIASFRSYATGGLAEALNERLNVVTWKEV